MDPARDLQKTRHSMPGIRFSVGGYIFQPLNIVFERFQTPIPMHRHSEGCYEIHYIPYGKGRVILNGERYPLSSGSLFMTGPQIDHEQQIDPDDPMAEYCIFLHVAKEKARHTSDRDIASRFLQTRLWIGQDKENLLPLMQMLFYELNEQNPGYRIVAESLIRQCIVCMVRNYEFTNASGRTAAAPSFPSDSRALMMDECFLYEYNSITLDELSRRLSLSIRQTERLIREQYHQNFREKKAAARMHAAASMLLSDELSLSAVAQRLGFSSTEHFSSSFKRFYQISPGRYRRQNRTFSSDLPDDGL